MNHCESLCVAFWLVSIVQQIRGRLFAAQESRPDHQVASLFRKLSCWMPSGSSFNHADAQRRHIWTFTNYHAEFEKEQEVLHLQHVPALKILNPDILCGSTLRILSPYIATHCPRRLPERGFHCSCPHHWSCCRCRTTRLAKVLSGSSNFFLQ